MDTHTSSTGSFGSALRAVRLDRGLSLAQLARRVNYSKGHLSRVETEDKAPTDTLARRCDEALGAGGRLSGHIDITTPGRRGPMFNQLPRAVPGLVGRAAMRAALDRTLHLPGGRRDSAQSTVVVMDGQAGIGKTATAVSWAHDVARHFPDGVLFADLGGFGPGLPADETDVLRHFMASLGEQVEAGAPAEHLAARYRSLMTGRRSLIILDNAADAKQVRPLLPAAGGSHVLVTSRDRLSGLVVRDGAERVTVHPMTEAEALRLLEDVAGPWFDPPAAPDIAQSCGYVPLALRVAAENIAGHRSPLDALGGGADDATTLRTVLSWSYRTLTPAAAKALQHLAVRSGETISPTTTAELLGTDASEAHVLLEALAEIHLLQRLAPGAYRIDRLTAAFSAELNGNRPLRLAEPDDFHARVRRLRDPRTPQPPAHDEDVPLGGNA